MKVIIVGAGIAGLAIGWRLAQAGAHVDIFERGVAGRGATWAAAGMIAPGGELQDGPEDLARFARRSRAAWPEFAAELESESGCMIGFSEPGSLLLAHDGVRANALEQRAAQLAASAAAEWVGRDELRRHESMLSPDLHGALHIKDDAVVDNRLVSEALLVALAKRAVPVHEHSEIRGVLISEGRARGALSGSRPIPADAVVAASGAWMNWIGESAVALPPITPVKGQMLCVQPPQATSLPRRILWGEDVYLVARAGRLLIGTTVEDEGFDTSVSRDACARLLSAATRIIPDIAEWRVSEMWAGLRPRTPDGAPVLGATHMPGLYVAGGQYRNGILFAPAVADAMSRIVLRSETGPELLAFDPGRFASG